MTVQEHGIAAGHVLLLRYLNRAAILCGQDYVTGSDIDTAMRLGCGLTAGPLAMVDDIGRDRVLELMAAAAVPPAPLLTTRAWPGRPDRDSPRSGRPAAPEPVAAAVPSSVGIVGSGTMAVGIAQALVVHGLRTTLVARRDERAETARRGVAAALDKAVARGRVAPATAAEAAGRLRTSVALDDLADCDLVVEAVVEEEDAKRAVFAALDRVCRPGTVLATTTSSLSVADCAAATGRPADVVGMHFFNPASVMRLVEVGHTPHTAPRTTGVARALARHLGKVPVCCPDRSGFIVNYLLFPYLNDAVGMVERGEAGVAELDREMEEAHGFPLGPFALLDTIGLDVSLAILRRLHQQFGDPATRPGAMLTRLVAEGRLGRKTGAGFHAQRPGRGAAR
ncbi:3-hydroxyacyl-CoA dehydrogenase NAD-binding domain-containing protein [Micromonospora sp. WMMD987]|uniref:3-hydroxyacyl-CoA dehydrogenase family protein n=1 Tax=Micromonospora sp. WMMD987 TaxID=3016089 RepID=UPI00249BABD4|nr:3-hydroxyacyl-CoA dehydrogenase NAD-binding domain-containing protein [Micromonospora sp. WMMD987]WFE97552.1 3-hydroxyacyl-CoA dehydrogenase NAD-binding domain-containing protein [Micromonospora sp. WMMD987]